MVLWYIQIVKRKNVRYDEPAEGGSAMLDVSEVGGTPLLGLTRPVIKVHGSSDARAIRSAVKQAIACVEADVCGRIEKNIAQMRIKNT